MNPDTRNPHRIAYVVRAMVNGGLLAGCLAFGSSAQAAISFTFDYGADTGTGFWDATLGADRKAAMNTAASEFSSLFGSYFTNSGTILLDATATDDYASTNLASAGSYLAGTGTPGFGVGEVIRTKLQTGTDLTGAGADGVVDVNFGQPWQLDLNTPATGAQYDFYSTVYHEFTHALGFASLIAQDGSPFFGTKTAGEWGTYDQFLVDKNGNRVVDNTFALNQGVWDAASVGGTSPGEGMFWNGANAVAANGGNAVGLYSPTTWADGSSVSHLDTDNGALAGMMMLHATGTGPGARDYSAIEVGMLTDIGYTPLVPEPETYAMMLAGLGLVGWSVRRRKA